MGDAGVQNAAAAPLPRPLLARSKSYVFGPCPQIPFQIVAKRYWIGECPDVVDSDDAFHEAREDVYTLVLMHGNRVHKEQWEPAVQRLFEHQYAAAPSLRTIRFHDMWLIDMPNHGDWQSQWVLSKATEMTF